MYIPDAVLIHAGINDVLNDKSQSNTEDLLSNNKYMVDRCRNLGVKNILISSLVFTTRVSSEVLECWKKSMKNLVLFVVIMV